MGWRKQWLHEQERIAEGKETAQLVLDAMQLWEFIPQTKVVLPSKSRRRFRLMQIATHRELRKRGIYPYYVDVVRDTMSIVSNLR